ncbi:MAG: beta strand repeat-containing protein [Acidithiobacillus sp.]
MKQAPKFGKKQLGVAIAATLAIGLGFSAGAYAAGMPGLGTVTEGSVIATNPDSTTNINTGGTGTTITGLISGATLAVNGDSVVQWGGITKAGVTDTNPAGFNISAGNVLKVTSTNTHSALLNVDASGNPSVIAGKLLSTGADGVKIFIANANGITVTSTGTIAAPYIGLIGANLAVGNNSTGVPTAGSGSAQAIFGTGGTFPVTFANGNGNISVQGALVGPDVNNTVNPANGILIAGSGSVNVDFTSVQANLPTKDTNDGVYVLGGVSAGVSANGIDVSNGVLASGTNYGYGNSTTQAPGYFATNVSLNNAPSSVAYIGAYGNLTFTGNSVLPTDYDWKGTLTNTGDLQLSTNSITGQAVDSYGQPLPFQNRWYNTPNATATGFVQGQVGAVVNSGTITSGSTSNGTTGLTVNSNGFTSTGTLTLVAGNNNSLTITSNSGDIDLGGVVQTSDSQAAIKSASLTINNVGNINVTTPLTIGNSGANNDASFSATAKNGNVNISSSVDVTSSTTGASGDRGSSLWTVAANGVTISGAQSVTNSNGTNTLQPTATISVNQGGNPVNITSTGSINAGDISIGNDTNRAALTLDGTLTATNTGYSSVVPISTSNPTYKGAGSINLGATYIQSSATENMTAQQFNFDYTRYVNKYQDRAATGFIGNGVLITPVGSRPTLNLTEAGSNLQNTNITAAGNITVNANSTTVNFKPGAFLNGTGEAGTSVGNAGSNVVLTSSGNITLGSSSANSGTNGTGASGSYDSPVLGDSGNGYFWVPGLLYLANINSASNPTALSTTGSITALHSVYNDYLLPIAGYKGIFFGTNNLTINGSLFTNMNSNVNFLTPAQLSQYKGVIYQVKSSPSDISNTLNVVPNENASGVYSFNNF